MHADFSLYRVCMRGENERGCMWDFLSEGVRERGRERDEKRLEREESELTAFLIEHD